LKANGMKKKWRGTILESFMGIWSSRRNFPRVSNGFDIWCGERWFQKLPLFTFRLLMIFKILTRRFQIR
jgi:hypothetical protein